MKSRRLVGMRVAQAATAGTRLWVVLESQRSAAGVLPVVWAVAVVPAVGRTAMVVVVVARVPRLSVALRAGAPALEERLHREGYLQ